MDEALSPILGSLRAIRRSISSSVFNPVQRPAAQAPQADPTTTNLISQNSLTLGLVSQRLDGISQQMQSLNVSLLGIKENLSVTDSIERQREAAKQNRERILAEQGLRQGKEDALEKNIQNSLTSPVKRISAKTRSSLFSLEQFFGFLTAGWLTKTGIDLLRARADGNTKRFEELKGNLTRGLVAIGATLTALSLGIGKNLFFVLGRLGVTLSRAALGGILFFKIELLRQALVDLFRTRFPRTTKGVNSIIAAIVSGILLFGDQVSRWFSKNTSGVAQGIFKTFTNWLQKNLPTGVSRFLTSGTSLKALFTRVGGFIGGTLVPLVSNFVISLTLQGQSLKESLAETFRFAIGLEAARRALKKFGNAPKSNFGKALYGIALLVMASGVEGALKDNIDGFLKIFGIESDPDPRAGGGPVAKGEQYLVGENGPELFIPKDDGRIVANNMIEAMKVDQSQLRAAIASIDENNLPPNIISFPIAGGSSGVSRNINTPPSSRMKSNVLPNILFNEKNIHLIHATAMYGVNV